jgi:predicted metal-dependent phosphoesterase TrpH
MQVKADLHIHTIYSSDSVITPKELVFYSSLHGHIVGLNVNTLIPRGLPADETVNRIHDADGIAIACHPFALFKGSIGNHASNKFDAVEAINASAFPFNRATRQAHQLAERLRLPKVAGTDAHYAPVIGQAYTLINSDADVEAMVKAISNGQCEPAGTAMSLAMRLENQGRFLRKYLNKSKKT